MDLLTAFSYKETGCRAAVQLPLQHQCKAQRGEQVLCTLTDAGMHTCPYGDVVLITVFALTQVCPVSKCY